MQSRLSLKLGDYWSALGEDPSISFDLTSPLWNESGSFSYPFTVPYSANLHIFGSCVTPEGDVNLSGFREPFSLYVDGLCLLSGDAVCTSEEVDEENDEVELELRSSGSSFDDLIDGKRLRDLHLEDVYLGLNLALPSSLGTDNLYFLDYNLDQIYPERPFVNIPIVLNSNEEKGDTGIVLSASRAFSAPCFYLMYIVKRIFQHLGYQYDEGPENEVLSIEDFRRIILINTHFAYASQPPERLGYSMFATSDNLPDIEMSDIFESLKSAFGVRVVIDEVQKKASLKLIRSVFRSTDIQSFPISRITAIRKKHQSFNGIEVCYSNDDADSFSYDDYNSVMVYDSYENMMKAWTLLTEEQREADNVLKITKDTGNYFRTKVDKSTFDKASLFEVGQFNSYKAEGRGTMRSSIDKFTIPFTPFIPTVTQNCYNQSGKAVPSYAYYVDAKIDKEHFCDVEYNDYYGAWMCNSLHEKKLKEVLDYDCGFTLGILRTTPTGSLSENHTEILQNADGFGNAEWVRTTSETVVTSDCVTNENAVYDYNGTDPGIGTTMDQLITLKIWACKQNLRTATLTDPTGEVTGESAYNNNPTGVMPNRGLAPQFLSEYLHFLQYRKPVEVAGDVEVADLANIQWGKYYIIEGYRCLLNRVSFDVTHAGVGAVTMEVYVI